MYSEAAKILTSAQSISIIAHTSPDADTLGSCFALKAILDSMGKAATLYTDCKVPEYLSFLEGDYVIYSSQDHNAATDVCVCVDCGDLGRVGERVALMHQAKTSMNIDHHPTNTQFAQLNLVNSKAAATAEMIYELIGELNLPIDSRVARFLYTALVGDTGGFRYSNTTAGTMRIAAQLLETGIEGWRICGALFDSNPEKVVRIKCHAVSEADILAGGRVGIAMVTQELLDRYHLAVDEVEGIVEMVRGIQGIEVAVLMKQGKDRIKISMRSSEFVDVAAIAAKFGGGGHQRAAGFSMEGDMAEAKKRIAEAVVGAVEAL